jgi:hypothetical protein
VAAQVLGSSMRPFTVFHVVMAALSRGRLNPAGCDIVNEAIFKAYWRLTELSIEDLNGSHCESFSFRKVCLFTSLGFSRLS